MFVEAILVGLSEILVELKILLLEPVGHASFNSLGFLVYERTERLPYLFTKLYLLLSKQGIQVVLETPLLLDSFADLLSVHFFLLSFVGDLSDHNVVLNLYGSELGGFRLVKVLVD